MTAGSGVLSFGPVSDRGFGLGPATGRPGSLTWWAGPWSTITRELAKGRVGGPAGDQGRYRAVIAQNRVNRNRCRAGRPARLVPGSSAFAEVVKRLARWGQPRADRGPAAGRLP